MITMPINWLALRQQNGTKLSKILNHFEPLYFRRKFLKLLLKKSLSHEGVIPTKTSNSLLQSKPICAFSSLLEFSNVSLDDIGHLGIKYHHCKKHLTTLYYGISIIENHSSNIRYMTQCMMWNNALPSWCWWKMLHWWPQYSDDHLVIYLNSYANHKWHVA